MSITNILRTREKYKRLHLRAFGSIWRYGTTSGCKLEGRLTCLGADMQQPTACRKDEGTRVRRVWLRSSSQTESRSREAAQLGVSGLDSHARGSGQEGGRLVGGARLRKHPSVMREIRETHVCSLWRCRSARAGHHGGKHLSGLDRFRVRRRRGVRVQRSHRRTLSTLSDGAWSAMRSAAHQALLCFLTALFDEIAPKKNW